MVSHDSLCEMRQPLIWRGGCRCASRAYAADPITDAEPTHVVKVTPGDLLEVYRDAFTPLIEYVQRCVDAFKDVAASLPGPPPEPTGVRERALWLRQHRNTGPDHPPDWLRP